MSATEHQAANQTYFALCLLDFVSRQKNGLLL